MFVSCTMVNENNINSLFRFVIEVYRDPHLPSPFSEILPGKSFNKTCDFAWKHSSYSKTNTYVYVR